MFKMTEVLLQLNISTGKKDYVLPVLSFFPRLRDSTKFIKKTQTCYMNFHQG